MELLITRQLVQFLQSVLLGASAGALYDILRPFRALLPRLTGLFDFLYGLTLTAALLAFLLRPADGELRGYMILGASGGLVLFYGILSRPLRPVWEFWAGTLAATVKLCLSPLVRLRDFLKKSARAGKNLFYFAGKCYIIRHGFRRPPDAAPIRRTGGAANGPKKKQNRTKTPSRQRRGHRAGAGHSGRYGVAAQRTARATGNRAFRERPLSRPGGRNGAEKRVPLR
ncbi:MAG: spore cortex biosynthesis protein YabQ [Oscillibacter sp.]|nr:spore cortex biosynthesis protein YabQ [Oscillibacter sp.]MBQ9618528.1 spore cortex biosynthesis protein YabQ [Oscillibacter sp.]